MSAELLRRAAAKMRENADAATRGPWSVAHVDGQGFAVHHGEHDTVSLYSDRPNAEHIASWHPAVALAVADWLDFIAPFCRFGDDDSLHAKHALAVARTYLGES
ncbi:hypothetical protein GCM10011584_09730 [Nocardioides phosphati]|uniref:MmcQ/YjbR family DNA-binding protein n=1 Tax=Nocardioides phosphati TaxID=1867775 RepID=A0ABQ2N6Y7_9ACTN|nr:hypothetical protein [Nocardioides phosphati]GGO86720.1 hypothetical protein GCM10011584_09730 [Nocardioides phosphati]